MILKELMDNALDACEEVGIAPVISLAVKEGLITIRDNGGGIDVATIKNILNYAIRVSSREAYVSPTRGAQGNALKTILAMAYVLNRETECKDDNADAAGVTIIETRGEKHRIEFQVDHINNEPKITHDIKPSSVNVGTRITVRWPKRWEWDDCRAQFQKLAEAYTWVNPHLTLRGSWDGKPLSTLPRPIRLGRNGAQAIRPRRIGIMGAASAVPRRPRGQGSRARTAWHRARIHCRIPRAVRDRHPTQGARRSRLLASIIGAVLRHRTGQPQGIAKLLASMRKHTKPVEPKHLGVIGADHLKQRFLAAGGNADTFKYELRKGMTDEGIPYVIEVAFGLHQSGLRQDAHVSRKIITGANWSVGIVNPFRSFGSTGEGLENTLANVRANASHRLSVLCIWHRPTSNTQTEAKLQSS